MKIFIKTEGGKLYGFGHITRCISLAKELEKNNFEVIFLVNYDKEVLDRLKINKLSFEVIRNKKLGDELIEIENLVIDKENTIILTDSYHMSDEYLNQLKNICKYCISIDDLNLYDYHSDLVINSNIYAIDLDYKKVLGSKYLLGCDYIIFRDEFSNCKPININKKCSNILITMGGSDLNNFTLNIIKYLKNIKNINLNVVIGPGFKNKEDIIRESYGSKNINLLHNPKNMKDIMIQNDIAISSASTTSYELALLGIPSILIIQVKNQIMVANKMDELGAAINLGWFYDVNQEILCKAVKNLIDNYDIRNRMSKISRSIVSEDGKKNIVKEINELIFKDK